MSLYVDKYRPKTLDALDYHHGVSARLKALVSVFQTYESFISCSNNLI